MKIHLIGVCGTGMASLAGLLKQLGHELSGSDAHFYAPMSALIASLQIETFEGYAAEHLAAERDGQRQSVSRGLVVPHQYLPNRDSAFAHAQRGYRIDGALFY